MLSGADGRFLEMTFQETRLADGQIVLRED